MSRKRLIDHAMVGKSLTFAEAAKASGVSTDTLRKLYRGEDVSQAVVGKIAAGLEINAVDLWSANDTQRSAA